MNQHMHILGDSRLGKELRALFPAGETISRSSESKPFNLGSDAPSQFPLKSGTLCITTPPLLDGPEIKYEEFFQAIAELFEMVILISSTSIYADTEGDLQEDCGRKNKAPLFFAEEAVKKNLKKHLIIRPAGLYDDLGHPLNSLIKKKPETLQLSGKVNLVHRKDVARAIEFLIKNGSIGSFNVCRPEHPRKYQFYKNLASKRALEFTPTKLPEENACRTINSKKLTSLGFTYLEPL